jgi:hypothetical protein
LADARLRGAVKKMPVCCFLCHFFLKKYINKKYQHNIFIEFSLNFLS